MDSTFEKQTSEEGQEFYFQWHITNLCDHRCKHCYHENYDTNDELDDTRVLAIANRIGDALEAWNMPGAISLTGGEPFSRRQTVHHILEEFSSMLSIKRVDILTNGTQLDEDEVAFLSRFPTLRRIQLSLEGATSESHDIVRGVGDFSRVMRSIRLLKSAGLSVSVMTTLTRNNKSEVLALADILAQENVDYFSLDRFIPEGRSSEHSEWTLSRDELRDVYSELCAWGLSHTTPTVLMYRTLFTLCAPDEPTVGAMCSVGMNALTIMPNGDILPCRRLPIPLGNVLSDGILKVWFESELLWQVRDSRNLKGKCAECQHIPVCRGCRAMAYAETGDYLGEDPQCWK